MSPNRASDRAVGTGTARAVVAGGGIVGTWHALELATAGFSVEHLEAEAAPMGASVRNFGLVWVSGRRSGAELDVARRARRRWEEIAAAVPGVGFRPMSSLTVAGDAAARAVMEVFARHPDASGRSISFLEPDEVRACNPAVRGDVAGALHCAEDAVVEPRLALGALRDHLAAAHGTRYRFHPGRRVVAAEPHTLVDTTGTRWEGDLVVLATGAAYDHLPGSGTVAGRLRRVRLQMLQTAPFATRLTTSLADADTLRYYPAYESAPLARLGEQTPVAAEHHLQLLLVQRPDGGLTIGDTHAYEEPFDFALCEDPTRELLDRARRILGPAPARAAPLGGRLRAMRRRRRLPARGDPAGRLAGDGSGRSRHDVLPGHRRGHPGGRGRGRMIGPFALACLDMAGTTVRDDGAVEAAFATALAAVGITVGGRRFDEAEVVVRQTMGWSKADVFARLLGPAEAERATAAFASAYEAIVTAGDVREMPGALGVLRDLRSAGVKVCLTTGFAPLTRTPCWAPWAGAPRWTWPSRPPTSAGAPRAGPRPRSHGPPGRGGPRGGGGGGRHGQRPRGGERRRGRGGGRRAERRPRPRHARRRRADGGHRRRDTAAGRPRAGVTPGVRSADQALSTKTGTCSIIPQHEAGDRPRART